jgi:hypothetical protein
MGNVRNLKLNDIIEVVLNNNHSNKGTPVGLGCR